MKNIKPSVQETFNRWDNSEVVPEDHWLRSEYDAVREAGIWQGSFPHGKDHTGDLVFLVTNAKRESCSLVAISPSAKNPQEFVMDFLPEGDTPIDAHIRLYQGNDDLIIVTDDFRLALELSNCTKCDIAFVLNPKNIEHLAIRLAQKHHVILCSEHDNSDFPTRAVKNNHIKHYPEEKRNLLKRSAEFSEKIQAVIDGLVKEIKESKANIIVNTPNSDNSCFYRVRSELMRCVGISEGDASIAVCYAFLAHFCEEHLHYMPLLGIQLRNDHPARMAMPYFFDVLMHGSNHTISRTALTMRQTKTDNQTLIVANFDACIHNKQMLKIFSEGTARYTTIDLGGGRYYSKFSPKIYFTTKLPPPEIVRRSLMLTVNEELLPNPRDVMESKNFLKEMSGEIRQWCQASEHDFSDMKIEPIENLNSFHAGNFDGILKVAACLSQDIHAEVRMACGQLAARSETVEEASSMRLLQDVFRIFENSSADRLSSEELVGHLINYPNSPWKSFIGNSPITKNKMAYILKSEFDIESKPIRILDSTPRGYLFESIEKAHKIYVSNFE